MNVTEYGIENLIELFSRADKAWLAISVLANSVVGRKRMRATSRATFPWKQNELFNRDTPL